MKKFFTPAVWLASLGYFVDIFDLLLFSIVRKPSLASLGLNEADQIQKGLMLHNLQMTGMLVGGVFWGVLADKRGRLSVLFASILLYSLGNIANAFVHSVEAYAVCRLISGLGLAGELGAGITLVAESLPKDQRGIGTLIVATIGVSGAVVAGVLGETFDWRTTYLIGGALGFALLLLRINTAESLLFKGTQQTQGQHHIRPGNFLSLFTHRNRFKRFAHCILVGVPIWFVVGTLIQLAPEFAKYLGVTEPVTAGRAVMFCYGGLVFGDFTSGALSQVLKHRLRVIRVFLIALALSIVAYFSLGRAASPRTFYWLCGIMGYFTGYWALFVTIAAEQFGTNLRATVATSAPNFVRASVVPMSLVFAALRKNHDIATAAQWVGAAVLLTALISTFFLEDTFQKDLGYHET